MKSLKEDLYVENTLVNGYDVKRGNLKVEGSGWIWYKIETVAGRQAL